MAFGILVEEEKKKTVYEKKTWWSKFGGINRPAVGQYLFVFGELLQFVDVVFKTVIPEILFDFLVQRILQV